jgi:hypothetical protein
VTRSLSGFRNQKRRWKFSAAFFYRSFVQHDEAMSFADIVICKNTRYFVAILGSGNDTTVKAVFV